MIEIALVLNFELRKFFFIKKIGSLVVLKYFGQLPIVVTVYHSVTKRKVTRELLRHKCTLAVPKFTLPNFGNFLKQFSGIKW